MVPEINIQQQTVNMLPTEQRKPKWEIFAKALNAPDDRLAKLLYFYIDGSTDSGYWSNATVYSKGDYVRALDGVYESLADSNLGNALNDKTWWLKVLPTFIGSIERSRYTNRYLAMTWQLNRHFGTTFRQPPYPSPYGGSGTYSDIYITTDAIVDESFLMYPDADSSSGMYPTYSTGFMFDPPTFAATSTFKYTVHFPAAVYTALGSSADTREKTARQIIDKFNTAGIKYSITTY